VLEATRHNGKRLAVLLAERLMREALGGKFTFAREVVDRLEGKAPDAPKGAATAGGRTYVCPPPRVLVVLNKELRADPPLPNGRENARAAPAAERGCSDA
jgi:hypothetical protein